MTSAIVLDASAVIAMLKEETGGDDVAKILNVSCMSIVNFTEVASYYALKGWSRKQIENLLSDLPIEIVDVDLEVSWMVAMWRPTTDKIAGVGIADRYCMALAKQKNCAAWTADQAWQKVADSIGVKIHLIRQS